MCSQIWCLLVYNRNSLTEGFNGLIPAWPRSENSTGTTGLGNQLEIQLLSVETALVLQPREITEQFRQSAGLGEQHKHTGNQLSPPSSQGINKLHKLKPGTVFTVQQSAAFPTGKVFHQLYQPCENQESKNNIAQ